MLRRSTIAIAVMAMLAVGAPVAGGKWAGRAVPTPPACVGQFTEKQFKKYVRGVYHRRVVSNRARGRMVRMIGCLDPAPVRHEARLLRRRLKAIWVRERQAPPVAGLPFCTWERESGGDYNAVNPSSGAYGKYQIMPLHWNGGVCSDLDRSPSGQETCAARIYKTSGSGAWVNC